MMLETETAPSLEDAALRVDARSAIMASGVAPVQLTWVDPHRQAQQWDSAVLRHGDATVFHSAAWARVLARTYQHKPFYLSASYPDGSRALLPLMEVHTPFTAARGVSLPFSDFCFPLLFGEAQLEPLLDPLLTLGCARGWKQLTIRHQLPISAPPSLGFFAHEIDLRVAKNDLFARFAPSVRRAIRKAQASDLEVEITDTPESVTEFYRLHEMTRRRHGIPPQPWKFFRNIYEELISPGHGFITAIKQNGRVIAAALFFHWGKRALYKFGASDISFQQFRPNDLLFWEAIQHLIDRGAKSLHLGRTDLNDAGLRRFKLGFGATESPLTYSRYDFRKSRWSAVQEASNAAAARKIFRRLPLPLNRMVGATLYPHMD